MVVDASAAAAWFLQNQQTVSALELFGRMESVEAIAPVTFEVEFRNVLLVAERRRAHGSEDSRRYFAEAVRLIVVRQEPLREAAERTLPLARETGLKLYDAMYLELAVKEARPLASRDGQLIEAARFIGVDVLDLRG